MPDPMLTKRELATWLQVSLRTVERLPLPSHKVGGQRRYRRDEIESWLDAKRGTKETPK